MMASRFAIYYRASLSVRIPAFAPEGGDFLAFVRYWIPFKTGAVVGFFVDLPKSFRVVECYGHAAFGTG
jgi:hypothetical protein